MRLEFIPASRFLASPENSGFPAQFGKVIYTKVERTSGHWRDLTLANAKGVIVQIGRWCFYLPLFFWKPLV